MKLVLGLATAVALAGVASAGKLSDASRESIGKLLETIGAIYGKEVGETRFGELASGQIVSLPFEGDRTVEYYVNVFCDDDCTNVDLAILDGAGVEIDVDDADENGPVLNIQAAEYRSPLDKPKGIPRPMTIEIRMKDCKAETCGYGLRISQAGQGINAALLPCPPCANGPATFLRGEHQPRRRRLFPNPRLSHNIQETSPWPARRSPLSAPA